MLDFKPVQMKRKLGQVMPALALPPSPDVLFTGYTGVPGLLETVAVLGVSAAAAWAGINTARTTSNKYLQAAGWVGGVGAALIGLLYLGTKSGFGQQVGFPAVRISPS